MATTDARLAVVLLEALDRSAIDYRVLHGAEHLASAGELSDIDIVVREEPLRVIARLAGSWHVHGLLPIMLWEYDVGSLTSFWCTPGAEDGVQLDLLHDPLGRGRYGLRTDEIFRPSTSAPETWPPRLSPVAEAVYLLSKRTLKGDRERSEQLVEHAVGHFGNVGFRTAVASLLSPRARRRCDRALDGSVPTPRQSARIIRRQRYSLRGLRRLLRPAGCVVRLNVGQRRGADVLAKEFSRFLVRARSDVPRGRIRRWLAVRKPVLLLLASTDTTEQCDLDRERARVVAEMAGSVTARITASRR